MFKSSAFILSYPCSHVFYLGSPKLSPFPGYNQGFTDGIRVPVSSWMFQEISRLSSFKLLFLLHICVRGCVPAERIIWIFIWKRTQEVFARNENNVVRNSLDLGATCLGCQQGNPFPIQQLNKHSTYFLYLDERLNFQEHWIQYC